MRWILILLLLCYAAVCFGQTPAGPRVDISVHNQAGSPVAGVQVQIRDGQQIVAAATTDQLGRAAIAQLKSGRYRVTATHDNFEPFQRDVDLTAGESVSLDLTLVPPLARRESIEVKGAAATVEQGASTSTELTARTAKELPTRPATVADALPLIPGVVREPGGALVISASPEHRSALVVNSADVTDPATGQFGLTVPIDSVENLNVYQTAYLAEYGRFTAGLVSVETRRGGDRWKWEFNDPLPEFRIRSYHLRGLKTATPRLNFEGPLLKRKLYISEGSEYEYRKTAVYTLPFPHNQKKQDGLNSFTQLDWIVSAKHLVTGTLHLAPQRMDFVNMDFFNPEPVTPDATSHNYTGTLADHLTVRGGVLETTFSITRFDAGVWGHGPVDQIITPTGNRGNYFTQQQQDSSRVSARPTFALAPFEYAGNHRLKIGGYVAATSNQGQVMQHPVDLLDASGIRFQRIAFPRARDFDISDTESAYFVQDSWVVSPRLAVDLGIRTDSQQISGARRVAPRAGAAWSPFADSATVIRAGFGLFYDRVPLNVYGFNRYPDQVITMYDAAGNVSAGPFLYLNTLGQVRVRFPFVSQKPIDGNFSPRSTNWSLHLERTLSRYLKLRTSYLQNDSAGLVTLHPVAPDPATRIGAYLLNGSGRSRYRQFEAMARVRAGEGRELFLSYVHSRARGDLNDFPGYLGSFPSPIIRPNQFANLPVDLPNRVLAWGAFQLPRKFQIFPLLEYRTGFPYIVTDAAQNYVGVPNESRFPGFLSADTRVSKDFKVNAKYSVRFAISGFNLTNHFNPEAVHANIADPAYGFFFGHRGRRFTADFDVLF